MEFLLIAISALVIGILTLVHTLHVRSTDRMDLERKTRLLARSARTADSDRMDGLDSGVAHLR